MFAGLEVCNGAFVPEGYNVCIRNVSDIISAHAICPYRK
jgi:hypothetical protein